MHLCLNKLVSKVWKKGLSFGKSESSFGHFSSVSNATNFKNKDLVFFKVLARCWFSPIGYPMQISGMILEVNIISRKVSIVSVSGAGGSEDALRTQRRFWGVVHLKKIFRL